MDPGRRDLMLRAKYLGKSKNRRLNDDTAYDLGKTVLMNAVKVEDDGNGDRVLTMHCVVDLASSRGGCISTTRQGCDRS